MKKLSLLLVAFLLCCLSAHAQVRYFTTTGKVSLSGTGYKVTLQQPASLGKQVTLESVQVYCSVDCETTQTQNGTAATSTAGTAQPILPNNTASATVTIWLNSNVGSGNQIGGVDHINAGQTFTFDLSKITMGNTGTGTNYTMAIASITGTIIIKAYWSEK